MCARHHTVATGSWHVRGNVCARHLWVPITARPAGPDHARSSLLGPGHMEACRSPVSGCSVPRCIPGGGAGGWPAVAINVSEPERVDSPCGVAIHMAMGVGVTQMCLIIRAHACGCKGSGSHLGGSIAHAHPSVHAPSQLRHQPRPPQPPTRVAHMWVAGDAQRKQSLGYR